MSYSSETPVAMIEDIRASCQQLANALPRTALTAPQQASVSSHITALLATVSQIEAYIFPTAGA